VTFDVAAIHVADGFASDAGDTVLVGPIQLGPDDPATALTLLPEDEVSPHQGAAFFVELPIEIQALARQGTDQAWLTVEAMVGDIKRAIELDDRTLGGLLPQPLRRGTIRVLERPPGATDVGLGITYVAGYKESWGAP